MNKNFPYLQSLNDAQRAAALHDGHASACPRPLLILAGAGSGKTRVVTTKIAHLIRAGGVSPRSILAVTFTNKAAAEMRERAAAIEPRAADAMLRTFHSFGAWFLRRNGGHAGLASNFTIYDDDDSVSLLAQLMPGAQKSEVRRKAARIARAKDFFLNPDDAELDLIDDDAEFRPLYRAYEERLRATGNVDFGDLIKMPVEILRNNSEVRERFHERFTHILVDEYQDANVAQFHLLRALAGPRTYVCVVGDDDQSIYRFRGAEVRNIVEFPERFGGEGEQKADIIRLEKNYRSFAPILHLADSVVKNNAGRLGKTLYAERKGGKRPRLIFVDSQEEEARRAAQIIEEAAAEGADYDEWAILYRTNAQSLGFETEFLRRRLPYRIVGSLKFYEREEVKDALALLAFLANPRDEVNFRRVVNKPPRGLGAVAVERILAVAREGVHDGGDIERACRRAAGEFSKKAREGFASFLNTFEKARQTLINESETKGNESIFESKETVNENKTKVNESKTQGNVKKAKTPRAEELRWSAGLSHCVAVLLHESGIARYHAENDEIQGEQRLANLQEVVNAASLYPATREGLLAFLENIELDRSLANASESEEGADEKRVTLITVHNTKGLEFRRVIITGLEQGLFPRADKRGDDLEEERRLFYVAATRAMDELYLTTSATRRLYGRTEICEPSIFLREAQEADAECIEIAGGRDRAPLAPFAKIGGARNATSPDGKWQKGDVVFNDDAGYGEVVDFSADEEADDVVVSVKFQSGRVTRFLSRAQGGNYMRIR